MDTPIELEEQARIIWSSYWNKGTTWIPRVITGEFYIPTYTQVWEFRDRSRIHPLDGRILITSARQVLVPDHVLPQMPQLLPELQGPEEPTTEHRDIGTQATVTEAEMGGTGDDETDLENMAEAAERQLEEPQSTATLLDEELAVETPPLARIMEQLNAVAWPG